MDIMDDLVMKNELSSLRDFGLLISRRKLNFDVLVRIFKFIRQIICHLNSLVFIFETDVNGHPLAAMNDILDIFIIIFFRTKSHNLREITLGLNNKIKLNLKTLGELMTEKNWLLLRFQLHCLVQNTVEEKDIKHFLNIVLQNQKYVLELNLKIMREGKDLLKYFGFSTILRQKLKEKKNLVLSCLALRKLGKLFRREILSEIVDLIN